MTAAKRVIPKRTGIAKRSNARNHRGRVPSTVTNAKSVTKKESGRPLIKGDIRLVTACPNQKNAATAIIHLGSRKKSGARKVMYQRLLIASCPHRRARLT